MPITVRPIHRDDREHWLRMRDALWPGSLADHDDETRAFFEHGNGKLTVLVAELAGALVGFLELDERKYAPGADSSPVAFVEGWFVDAHVRGRGVGKALVDAAERTAIEWGYTDLASDSELDNTDAHAAHVALGFTEIERVVCFHKPLHRG